MSTAVFVVYSFTVEGFHRWAEAPGDFAYLRAKHHHYFHFTIEAEVSHYAREIEIIEAAKIGQQKMEELFCKGAFALASCEEIAAATLDALVPSPRRGAALVTEDGLQGAKVVRT